jgi:hypothetical protein
LNVTELKVRTAEWTSFCQLVQQLIANSVRRHTFTQWEMELLLDVQMAPVRKSSRSDTLRRYLKEVQLEMQSGAPSPQRFSKFFENEARRKGLAEAARKTLVLPRAS